MEGNPTAARERLFGYFKDRYGLSDAELAEDPPLVTFVDSLGQLELITFLRRDIGVELAPADISRETLGSPSRIVRYVETQLSTAAARRTE